MESWGKFVLKKFWLEFTAVLMQRMAVSVTLWRPTPVSPEPWQCLWLMMLMVDGMD